MGAWSTGTEGSQATPQHGATTHSRLLMATTLDPSFLHGLCINLDARAEEISMRPTSRGWSSGAKGHARPSFAGSGVEKNISGRGWEKPRSTLFEALKLQNKKENKNRTSPPRRRPPWPPTTGRREAGQPTGGGGQRRGVEEATARRPDTPRGKLCLLEWTCWALTLGGKKGNTSPLRSSSPTESHAPAPATSPTTAARASHRRQLAYPPARLPLPPLLDPVPCRATRLRRSLCSARDGGSLLSGATLLFLLCADLASAVSSS